MAVSWSAPGRSLRRGVLFGALALALAGIGVVGGAAALPGAASTATGVEECVPHNAKVKPGSQADEPNQPTRAEVTAAEKRFADRVRSKKLSAGRAATMPTVTVDVWAHVITKTDGTGSLTRRDVNRQLKVLNQSFNGFTSISNARTGFRFRLDGMTVTRNDDWYAWSDPDVDPSDDADAKTTLHRGGPETLNLYIAGLEDDLLGYATFPEDQAGALDGVVLLNQSLPGGVAPYDLGDTATHEVGHWLGLYHTFENGCGGSGDFVADTPYQLDGNNIFSCDANLDTCRQPGRDPVRNFMSYGDDACLNRFSAGQAQRMALQWLTYRTPPAQP